MNPFFIPPSSFRLSLRRHLRHHHQPSERGRKSEGRMRKRGLSLMYTGMKLIDPTAEAGIDLSQEFAEAKTLFEHPSSLGEDDSPPGQTGS